MSWRLEQYYVLNTCYLYSLRNNTVKSLKYSTQRRFISKRQYTMASTHSGAPAAISEIEETMARIRSHKGVEGILIMTKEGEKQNNGIILNSFLYYWTGVYFAVRAVIEIRNGRTANTSNNILGLKNDRIYCGINCDSTLFIPCHTSTLHIRWPSVEP